MIVAEGITVVRRGRTILDRIGLVANNGDMLGLVGPNGSGKTTLLRTLYGALVPNAGEVQLDGRRLTQLSRRAIARSIAVVPQEQPADHGQTVADLVMLGRLPHRQALTSTRARDDKAIISALATVGLSDLAERPIGQLSGGELQRAIIARAIAQEAQHLLLDEPTNHLDLRYQHDILGLLRDIGLTVVVVLHDLNLAARYCSQVVLLDDGQARATGSPSGVLSPKNIEPVYGVPTSRIATPSGNMHLLFADHINQTSSWRHHEPDPSDRSPIP